MTIAMTAPRYFRSSSMRIVNCSPGSRRRLRAAAIAAPTEDLVVAVAVRKIQRNLSQLQDAFRSRNPRGHEARRPRPGGGARGRDKESLVVVARRHRWWSCRPLVRQECAPNCPNCEVALEILDDAAI